MLRLTTSGKALLQKFDGLVVFTPIWKIKKGHSSTSEALATLMRVLTDGLLWPRRDLEEVTLRKISLQIEEIQRAMFCEDQGSDAPSKSYRHVHPDGCSKMA